MSRLVRAIPKINGARFAAAGENPTKSYFERVGKYIPGEIVAAHSTLNGLASNVSETKRPYMLVSSFLVCLILTPFYFARLSTPGQPKKKQLIVSTLAFCVWSYAVVGASGVFGQAVLNWYESNIAVAFLVIFSLVSGMIVPYQGES
jgi:hypothetical protein